MQENIYESPTIIAFIAIMLILVISVVVYIYIIRALNSSMKRNLKKNLEEKTKEKERIISEKEVIIQEEMKKKEHEKYITWVISPLLVIVPFIIAIAMGWFMLYQNYLDKSYFDDEKNIPFLYVTGFLWVIYIVYTLIHEDWDKKLEIKKELVDADKIKYDFNPNYFYTDSIFQYSLYQIIKISFYIINLITIALIWYLLFDWIWSMSIAPTTIIIVLLIIIIINQIKK